MTLGEGSSMWRSEDGSVESAFPFYLQVGLERLNLGWAVRLAKSITCPIMHLLTL